MSAGVLGVPEREPRRAGGTWRAGWWAFALLAYVPLLFTDPGEISADTKSYLYLDPSRMLSRATAMWDPHVGLGTTSHQNIGYLFPMGPYYWVMQELLHVPSWIAQRLWLGTLLFAAGIGMRYLLRTLRVDGPGVPVAMLAYAFTPYVLEYSARLSVLLGPWAALPWFVAFAARAVERRGWRYPALLALTVQLVGSVNASSLVYALVGPIVYALYAVVVTHESDWRRLRSAAWRTAVLTFVTSLWWLSGLFVEGRYGLNVLRFTEKVQDVSATSYPFEVVRGLGYWLFYGRDPVSFWNDALAGYTRNSLAVLLTLLVPAIAMLAGAIARWRHKLFFVALIVVGVAVAVGAAPYDNPSLAGGVFKSFAATSTLGLALRSTSRATPLVVLGFAALLAAGVNAFAARMRATSRPQLATGVAVAIGALCIANAVGPLAGSYYTNSLEHRAVPGYWKRALADADSQPHDTRLLSLPGADEAAYAFGNTIDPIEPGLIDRPFVGRELVPLGSNAGANLLQALDTRLQAGTLDTDAVAPISRLVGVGDVLLRLDLQTDRFRLVPATTTWNLFTAHQPTGLGAPVRYGTRIPGRAVAQGVPDFAVPPSTTQSPPPVAMLAVDDPQPIVRAQPADAPIVVAGDGEGVVDIASAGLLGAGRTILYAGAYTGRPAALRALPAGATLVLTDSNRRRAQRGGMSNVFGYTETAGEQPLLDDPSDQRIEVFPGETDASRTVDDLTGVRSVQATRYGSLFGFTTASRPSAAIDGDPGTAWAPGASNDERLVVGLEQPITTDHLTIVQPPTTTPKPYIDAVTLRFDGGKPIRRKLDATSQRAAGEVVQFPKRRFSSVSIEVDSVRSVGFGSAGIAEVRLAADTPGARPARAVETMRLPTDLLGAFGTASLDHPLVVAMSRESTMDDDFMRREFTLPTAREFAISGSAVLAPNADDALIDRVLGLPDAAHGGVTATSTARLADPRARASAAIDGDPTTAWNTPSDPVAGSLMRVTLPAARTIDHLDLELTADGRHSMPTQLRITGDDGSRTVDLGAPAFSGANNVDAVPVRFAALHGRTLSVEITKAAPRVGKSGGSFFFEPAGIAELGIPGLRAATLPAPLPARCLDGLFSVDGRPVSVRLSGSTADALAGRPLSLSACGSTTTLALGAGSHRLVAALDAPGSAGSATGVDLERLVLSSAAGGAPAPATALMTTASGDTGPHVTVTHEGATSATVRVAASARSSWLVFGQSLNRGWHATVDGHDLGASQLVNGYANGWLLPASASAVTVHISWTPQRVVSTSLWLSLVGGLLCLAIVLWPVLSRRRVGAVAGAPSEPAGPHEAIGLRPPLLEPSLAPRGRRTVVAVAVLTIAAGGLVRPWAGVLVGALAYLSIRDRRARLVVRYASAALLATIAVAMAGAQAFQQYATGTHWPTIYSFWRIPTWIALFLLLVDAVIEALWWHDERAP